MAWSNLHLVIETMLKMEGKKELWARQVWRAAPPGHDDRPGIHVVHRVGDVATIGPRALVERRLEQINGATERLTAADGPGALLPEHSGRQQRRHLRDAFQFNEVGLDRPTVLRWQASPRARLF